MKRIYFLLIILAGWGITSCHQNSSASEANDTTINRVVPPPADNTQADNPSLADTAYPKKDTMITKGDSSRSKSNK
jgi:hypothetical protein